MSNFVAVKHFYCYINFMNNEYKLTYYCLFVTRYKRDFFHDEYIEQLLIKGLKAVEEQGLVKIKHLYIRASYIYLIIDGIPSKSPNQIVTALKRSSYQSILEALPNLNSLWARPFMITTEKIEQSKIEVFLKTIKRRG